MTIGNSFYLGGVALVVMGANSDKPVVPYPNTYSDPPIQRKLLELYSSNVGALQVEGTELHDELNQGLDEALNISIEKLRKTEHRLLGGYALYGYGVNYFDALFISKPYAGELKRVYDAHGLSKTDNTSYTARIIARLLPSYGEVRSNPHFTFEYPREG
jgi:hypothetical protein